jgi:hypothetical protein
MPDQAADQALFPPVIFSLHAGAVYVQAYYNVWFTVTLAFSILLLRPCFTMVYSHGRRKRTKPTCCTWALGAFF